MDDTALAIGRVIAEKYRLEAVLGVGGMGAVFKATQLAVNRPVAVKLIQGPLLKHPEVEKRFRREAEAMGRLRHPSTVRLYDFGATREGELYMVMELLEGKDLAGHLAQHGALAAPAALRVAKQVLLALDEAHAQGIVHRDLKPANVFLAELHGGEIAVKVMDFGIAGIEQAVESKKLTRTGAVLGTPAYMSPEQAQGHALDGRSDLYALGVMLFEMVTGRVPFTSDSAVSLLLAQVTHKPPRLRDVLPEHPELAPLQPLLDALLYKTPDERPASAAAALALVERLLSAAGGGSESISTAMQLGAAAGPRRIVEPTGVRLAPTPTADATTLTMLSTRGRTQLKRSALAAVALAILGGLGWGLGGHKAVPLPPSTPLRTESGALHAVHIASAPSGATVSLDGVELGSTPYDFEFRKARDLTVSKLGFAPATLHIDEATEPHMVVQLAALPAGESAPVSEPVAVNRVRRERRDGTSRAGVAAEPAPNPPAAPAAPAAERPRSEAPVSAPAPYPASAPTPTPAPRPTPAPAAQKPQSISEAMKNLAAATTAHVSNAVSPSYKNVSDAKRAYKAGQIDERRYEDTVRALKQWRSERIKAEKRNYQEKRITRDEYERRVDRIDAEYKGS